MSLHAGAWTGDSATPTTGRRGQSWAARLLITLLGLLVGVLVWREFEPLLLFRPVDAVVVWSEVVMTQNRATGARRRIRYVPQVTYRYQVNGEDFLSAQYRRMNMGGSHSWARRLARRHVLGTRVAAWYSRFNPADSVLSRAPNPVWLAILALVCFMVWLFSLVAARGRPTAPPPIND